MNEKKWVGPNQALHDANMREVAALRIAADATERAAEAEDALRDLLAVFSGTPKSCGHEYECVCPTDRARAVLAKAAERAKGGAS